MAKRFNPYILGPPVSATNFYGREKFINFVRDTLAIATVRLLVFFGQRRIGKTSLLQNLGRRTELKNFIFIYNHAAEIADKTSYEALAHLSQRIAQVLDLPAPTKAQPQHNEDLFQTKFLTQVTEKIGDKRLVLLLDEFDIFERRRKIGNRNGTKSALDAIENLIENEPRLAFIVALGRGKEKLLSELSRITRIGHWAKVSLLEEADARRLIVEPARDQLSYLPEAVDAVFGLTAGHPYCTQLLCYEIFNELQIEGGDQVRVSDVEKAAKKALKSGSGSFDWLWEGLAPAERLVSSLMAEAATESPDHVITEAHLSAAFEKNRIHRIGQELTEAPHQLVDLSVIERKGRANYRYVVELVRLWICETHPVSQEREETLTQLNERAASEFATGQAASDSSTAIGHYQAAIFANPNHIQAQLALAGVLLEQGHADEAIEAYEVAYWLDEAKAKQGLEKAKKAVQLYTKADHPRPNLRPAWIGGGALLAVIALIVFLVVGNRGDSPTPTSPAVAERSSSTPTPKTVVAGHGTETPTMTPLEPTTQPATPTLIPATDTPTSVPTPKPTPTTMESTVEVPTPTSTFAPPTPTPTATLTATVAPPPTPTPTFIPGPTLTATPKYNAPVLLRPEPEALFIPNEDVILEWNVVGDLADNEQYAIRLLFTEHGKLEIQGHQVRATRWTIPRDLFVNRADGPEHKFEWYVFVERIEENGSPNTQISPNSETRVFYWR